MARRKIVSVEPASWVLASALQDYYRKVLPLGDSHRPHSDLQALMEAAPHDEPLSPSPTWRETRRIASQSWAQGRYPRKARAEHYRGGAYSGSARPIDTHQDELVREALLELDERDRTILELVYGSEMSLRQVEQLTGIPKTTVARRRDLAPQLFAEILKRKMPKLADKYHLD